MNAPVVLPVVVDAPQHAGLSQTLDYASEQALAPGSLVQVPLGRRMGSGWDVAAASVFLHSDEARFITGVTLPVGASIRDAVDNDANDSGSVMCSTRDVCAVILPCGGERWYVVWRVPGSDIDVLPGPTGTASEIADVLVSVGAL